MSNTYNDAPGQDPVKAGRDAAMPHVRALLKSASDSGNPAEFWMGALGILSGAMAAQTGILVAAGTLRVLSENAVAAVGTRPNVSVPSAKG